MGFEFGKKGLQKEKSKKLQQAIFQRDLDVLVASGKAGATIGNEIKNAEKNARTELQGQYDEYKNYLKGKHEEQRDAIGVSDNALRTSTNEDILPFDTESDSDDTEN